MIDFGSGALGIAVGGAAVSVVWISAILAERTAWRRTYHELNGSLAAAKLRHVDAERQLTAARVRLDNTIAERNRYERDAKTARVDCTRISNRFYNLVAQSYVRDAKGRLTKARNRVPLTEVEIRRVQQFDSSTLYP